MTILCAALALCALQNSAQARIDPFGFNSLFDTLNEFMHDRAQRSYRLLVTAPSQHTARQVILMTT